MAHKTVKLTTQQRDAVTALGNLCLVSCPGSGKTRTITAKLLRCVEEVHSSTRRVACITHTNVAADEIDARLRQTCFSGEDEYYEVTTIHSFALQRILRPFHRRLPEFRNGFQILTIDDEQYRDKRSELIERYGINARSSDDFENVQRAPDGTELHPDSIPLGAAREWFAWLDASAYICLNDIVYHSCRLVAENDFISSALASRFAWILVDEFQDSSPGQIFLLKRIHAFGRTQFFCVGDPNQSIYGFAGASPDLLPDFAKHVSAAGSYCLSGNFRSSAEIVACAERLIRTEPPMEAVGVYSTCAISPERHHAASPIDGVLEKFLPAAQALDLPWGEIAIFAPWWTTLFPLARGLRAKGIPVIGPGARPYKRDTPFSHVAEAVGAYLESREPEIARAVQRALFITLSNLTGNTYHSIFSYEGRVVICKLLAEATSARQEKNSAAEWLVLAAERFTAVLFRAELLPAIHQSAFTDSAAKMAQEIINNPQGQALSVEDLGIFARPKHCVHLMTIHKAKGREFEAVAVVDAHDGKLPDFRIGRISDPEIRQARYDEARRVVYVAATRAKRLLMFFTDSSHERNTASPFLAEMGL